MGPQHRWGPSRDDTGVEEKGHGEVFPSPADLEFWGSVVSSPSRIRSYMLAKNSFGICKL